MVLHSPSLPPWIVCAIGFGLIEFAVQLRILVTWPFQPVGDELEYLERGRSPSPFDFSLFHRLPALPMVATAAAASNRPIVTLRLASIVCSATAMAATAGTAVLVANPTVATVLCLLLLMMPERILLGSRIWPDVYLTAAISCIALSMALATGFLGLTTSAALAGCLLTIAVLTRLDALVLIPAVAISWSEFTHSASPTLLLLITGPPIAAFLGWWLISFLFLGQRWPDTTWRLNLGIATQEALDERWRGTYAVDDLIERHWETAESSSRRQRHESQASAVAYLRSIASRLRAMVGPDTFVSAKILSGNLSTPRSRFLAALIAALLRWSLPALISTSAILVLWHPSSAGWLALPSVAVILPAVAFHARTRFRLPLMYGLMTAAAASLTKVFQSNPPTVTYLVAMSCTLASVVVLARRARRTERT